MFKKPTAIIPAVVLACFMDVPINVPLKVLKVIYKAYPIVMIGLFAVSFVIKDKGK